MFKKSICIFFIMLSFCTSFTVYADSNASASLSSVSTEKNRLFETSLSVNTKVAAFIASLEFDQSKVEFRSAKATSENSDISVNTNDEGKITLAFVNEYGTDGEIIKFTFKAKSDSTFIDLKLQQVIDKNAKDILLKSVTGADITVTAKTVNKIESIKENATEQNLEQETSASALSESKNSLSINIPAKANTNTRKVIIIASSAMLLVAVGTMGFVLGRNSNSKNKDGKN